MLEILRSDSFDAWLRGLRDRQAKTRIEVRIRRLSLGNPGQHRVLKRGICEIKIDHGPGYRIYYICRNHMMVLLLCGGDKSTQDQDIERAQYIAKQWEDSTWPRPE
ncbi:type II toxin-antitoxin system RelE/ParE family toxin [Luteimonas sp. 8-5]|uniref:type II toxin-antitoxin system RelE/ParE family toxin n=1 Tax=Luteimonas sp. 8-5 TaxID=3039387 RepID=UPI002436EDDD|nr:type II toxin-antitoxin system RelE/ParE family toxin [Luteimonas sp. 8-5]MDG6347854.1 type II toxin-antitoxin system RelE/ParE family toxin [Luteimonas sp. 8-5]